MIQAGLEMGPNTPYGEYINVDDVDLNNMVYITSVNALQVRLCTIKKKENIYVDHFYSLFFFNVVSEY